MNKIKSSVLMLIAMAYGSASFAQSIDDGKKLYFYERYQSAKKVFSQLVAANANNIDAVYWLGQTEIALDDEASAKQLYQTTMMANSNSPLLLAGMGHIELLDGKIQDARQRFETAISLSQGKNAAVLNAIGFANVNAAEGDANYAIDKLKQATTLKGMKDPDVYINLGDAYRKIVDGGSAQIAYQNALNLDKTNPRPSFKNGKLYETQGEQQQDVFMKYYNDAIAADPTYGPVYYDLYSYFYHIDVHQSKDYLDKYIANSDPDPKDCYYLTSILFASRAYQQSLNKADECIAAAGANPYPNLFGIKAYAYDKLTDSVKAKKDAETAKGDSVNAKTDSLTMLSLSDSAIKYFEIYLAKQKPEKIGAGDYAMYGKNQLNFPGNDSIAALNISKAISLDTLEMDKLTRVKIMLDYYNRSGNYSKMGDWYSKIVDIRKQPSIGDYHTAGFNYFRGGNFRAAVQEFDTTVQKFPDDVYGWYMLFKSEYAIDTTMELGLANAAAQKVIDLGMADSVKNKTYIAGAYKYFIGYDINIKHDKAAAIALCDKGIALDPTDADFPRFKTMINQLTTRPTQSQTRPTGTRTGTTKPTNRR